MELIEFYIIFSVSVGLALLYNVYLPTMERLKQCNPSSLLVGKKYVVLTVLTVCTIFVSPLFLGVLLIPSISNRFEKALTLGLAT